LKEKIRGGIRKVEGGTAVDFEKEKRRKFLGKRCEGRNNPTKNTKKKTQKKKEKTARSGFKKKAARMTFLEKEGPGRSKKTIHGRKGYMTRRHFFL